MQEEIIYEASEVVDGMPIIEESETEVVDVEMFEAFQAPATVDALNHALLNNREISDAHPITAITGLREELDSIEALQTIYSDKKGNADYYEWADGHIIGEDGIGRFVTLNQDARTISICEGDDIFGVVVDNAAFVGGQDDIARDFHYGLVATSGAVHVKCELDVNVGDYVVSNAYGVATRTISNHGYKVVALHDIKSVPYATISLDIAADQIDIMGKKLQDLDRRVDINYDNIYSAMNVAQQAYDKATKIGTSNQEMSDKVNNALGKVDQMTSDVTNMGEQVAESVIVSAQAHALAAGAALYAGTIKDEVNNSLMDNVALRNKFAQMEQQITDVEDEVIIAANRVARKYEIIEGWDPNLENLDKAAHYLRDTVYYDTDTRKYHYFKDGLWKHTANAAEAGLPVAVSGLQVQVSDNSASIDTLTSWQGETNIAMARIEQKADANGAYIQSTVSNMDKYSVGPYSQAYNFTLEQAASVLEEGMIYVPTTLHTEKYKYTDTDGTIKEWERSFTPQYLYKWGKIDERYGWITVDKDYNETSEGNNSSIAVYFTTFEPKVSGSFGYWYTNGDTVADGYEPYTLYKWDLPYKYQIKDENGNDTDIEEYHWIAVATLAGNAQNRAVSQIKQDTNNIELRVTNTEGSVASVTATANAAGASVSQIVSAVGENGQVNAASIMMAVNKDESGVTIAGDKVNILGNTTFVSLTATENNTTVIDGGKIKTHTITSNSLNTDAIKSRNYNSGVNNSLVPSQGYSTEGTYMDLSNGNIYSQNFNIRGGNVSMKAHVEATSGDIGGFIISPDNICSEDQTLFLGANGDVLAQNVEANIVKTSAIGARWVDYDADYNEWTSVPVLYFESDTDDTETYNIMCERYYDNGGYKYIRISLTHEDGTPATSVRPITVRMRYKNAAGATIRCSAQTLPKFSTTTVYLGEKISELLEWSPQTATVRVGQSANIRSHANFVPDHSSGVSYTENNMKSGYSLGDETRRWSTVYAATSSIVSSDRNEKNTITPLADKHSEVFDKLVPVTYKFNVNTSDRLHLGLIAQDVKQTLDEVGIDSKDFAAYCEWEKKDGTIGCGLRYEEFISMCIYEIQKLKTQVKELEAKLGNETS
jgi:hypothetical protein